MTKQRDNMYSNHVYIDCSWAYRGHTRGKGEAVDMKMGRCGIDYCVQSNRHYSVLGSLDGRSSDDGSGSVGCGVVGAVNADVVTTGVVASSAVDAGVANVGVIAGTGVAFDAVNSEDAAGGTVPVACSSATTTERARLATRLLPPSAFPLLPPPPLPAPPPTFLVSRDCTGCLVKTFLSTGSNVPTDACHGAQKRGWA